MRHVVDVTPPDHARHDKVDSIHKSLVKGVLRKSIATTASVDKAARFVLSNWFHLEIRCP